MRIGCSEAAFIKATNPGRVWISEVGAFATRRAKTGATRDHDFEAQRKDVERLVGGPEVSAPLAYQSRVDRLYYYFLCPGEAEGIRRSTDDADTALLDFPPAPNPDPPTCNDDSAARRPAYNVFRDAVGAYGRPPGTTLSNGLR